MTAFAWIFVPIIFSVAYLVALLWPGFAEDIVFGILALIVWMAWFGSLIYELGMHVGTVTLTLAVLATFITLVVLAIKWRKNQ